MSDAVQDIQAAPVRVVEGPSAGTMLRRAREASGMHAEALAVSLKVPVHKLEALEADRYDLLLDTVFTRGLASSICRVLKIDPAPVLERLPQSNTPRLVNDTDRINQPFRGPGDGPAPSWRDYLRRPAVVIALALLLGAVVVFLWPASLGDTTGRLRSPASVRGEQGASEAPAQAFAASPAAAMQGAGTSTTPAPVANEAVPGSAGSPVAAGAALAPASIATTATATPPAAQDVPATAVPTGEIVVVRARGETWVEIVDGKGGAPMRKLLAAGETASAAGPLPLSVTIGKIDAAEVQVRGKPFDLRPVSRDNVARFEVK